MRTNAFNTPVPAIVQAAFPVWESEPWINTAAACEHLDISMPTIRRWIKDKKLTPRRTPTGELRFRRSQLDALIS